MTKAQLRSKALSLSNMPTGWSVDNSGGGTSNFTGCFAKLQATEATRGITRVEANYEQGNFPVMEETLITRKNAAHRYQQFVSILNGCRQVSLSSGDTTLSGSIGAMSFPTVGNASSAYAMTLSSNGINVGFDIIVFRAGQVAGDIGYGDLGSPDSSTVQAFVSEAVNKVEGKTTVTPTTF